MSGKLLRNAIFKKFRKSYGSSESKAAAARMLNSAMAGAALVAVADGHASFDEGAEAGNVADILQALQVFDPLTGVAIYNDYLHRARENEEQRAILRDIVQGVANDEDERTMLIEICHAISRADGRVVAEERREIADIASCLRLSAHIQK